MNYLLKAKNLELRLFKMKQAGKRNREEDRPKLG